MKNWTDTYESDLVEKFDKKYSELSTDARIEVAQVIQKFISKIDGIGYTGAKVLYICLHDYLTASDSMRAQLRRGA